MPLSKEEILELKSLDRDDQFLNVLKEISKGISDDASTQALVKGISEIESLVGKFSIKEQDTTALNTVLEQIRESISGSNSTIAESLNKAVDSLQKNLDSNDKIIKLFGELLLKQGRELAELKQYLKNNESAEWDFDIKRDGNKLINFVTVKRIK